MKIKKKIIELLQSNSTPHEVAFGIAVGVFIGVMPVYGVDLLIAFFFATIIPDINKIAVMVGANISLPPVIPLIWWASYNIGRSVLGCNYPVLTWNSLKSLKYSDIIAIYYPLFVGSAILGLICAVVFYCAVFYLVVKFKKNSNA